MQERQNRFIIDNIYEEDVVNIPDNKESEVEVRKETPTIESFQQFVSSDIEENKSDNFIDSFKIEVPKQEEVVNNLNNSDELVLDKEVESTNNVSKELVINVPTFEKTNDGQLENHEIAPTAGGSEELVIDIPVSEPSSMVNDVNSTVNVGEELVINVPTFEETKVEQPIQEIVDESLGNDSTGIKEDDDNLVILYDAKENTEDNESLNAKEAFESGRNLQDMINRILRIDNLEPVKVEIAGSGDKNYEEQQRIQEQIENKRREQDMFQDEISKVLEKDTAEVVFKSDLLEKLNQKAIETNQISILAKYGEDYCSKDFVTNPAIGRDNEIKQLILTLLTPEKSAILVGKPGIGKTSIVEGLAYRLERNLVPAALQGYTIINIKTPSLIGTLPTGETRLQTLVDELKTLDKVILFIDEIHMLIGATNDSSLDFANMFKEGLDRGQIKVIGATTTEEYERYILRDKAFVRRFQIVEVLEPSREHTIKILMGTLPKIEKETGAKMKYTRFIQSEIMAFITDITSEYKRVYGIGSRYPDICLNLLKEAFSQCIFNNRNEVTIFDVKNAILNSKNIYPDVIKKELVNFNEKFKKIIDEEAIDQL